MSSSGAGASESDLDAAIARLSGPQLVAHLRTTCRRADYDAAARVLGDRDRRLAQAEAALALAEAIVDLCSTSDDGDDDDELEEGEFRPVVAGVSCERKDSASKGEEWSPARVSCKRKEPASACSPDDDDDDDDKIPLSQLFMKKGSRAQPGANGEPNKGLQANSAGALGVDRPVISPVNRGIPEAAAEYMVGTPDDPKVAVFVQGTGNGQSGKNRALSRTMPSPPPTGSTAGNGSRKNGSKPDGSEGQARIGEKQGVAKN